MPPKVALGPYNWGIAIKDVWGQQNATKENQQPRATERDYCVVRFSRPDIAPKYT